MRNFHSRKMIEFFVIMALCYTMQQYATINVFVLQLITNKIIDENLPFDILQITDIRALSDDSEGDGPQYKVHYTGWNSK